MSALAKSQKAKAEVAIQQAQACINKKSWFSSSKQQNLEDGVEFYMSAANAYKVGGFNHEAGTTYEKSAVIHRDELANVGEAAKCYKDAGQCYKKSNAVDAVHAYQSAVALLTDAGRLTQAAKLLKECAELYESEEVTASDSGGKSSTVSAIECYEQAAQLFSMEESKSATSTCNAKVAELCSAALDPPDLTRAARLYDTLGRNCLESNLLKFNAKSYFLQAILCHLGNADGVGAEQAVSTYEGLDYTFHESREGKFAQQLIETVTSYDAEQFATACFEYDRISKLDPWKTSMLVKVKRSIQDDDNGGGGGNDDDDDIDLT